MSHITHYVMQSEINYSFNTKFCCTEKPWQDTRCSSGTCSTASMWRGCSVMSGLAIKQLNNIHCTLLNGETKYVFGPWIVYLQVNIFSVALVYCRFAAAFALRQRMLNFVQNIQYYMMFEVNEPTWHIMENNLKSVSQWNK